MTPIPVGVSQLDAVLPQLEWHFNSFCRAGNFTPDELIEDIRQKRRQLWLAWENGPMAAVLTSVKGNTLNVTHAAGHQADKWEHLFEYLMDWGRSIGCERIEANARKGWEPVLKKHGLRKTHVVMEANLG